MPSLLRSFAILVLGSGLAASGVRYALHRQPPGEPAAAGKDPAVLYYQSAMHPWIKSDKPGRCTICGMDLTPVFEGDQGFHADGDVVALTQSQIQVLHVETAEAKIRPLTRRLRVAGMIDDDDTRHQVLSAYVDGRIEKLHINYVGAVVAAGEPLAEIYSPTLLAMEREYAALQRAGSGVNDVLLNGARLKLLRMGLSAAQIEDLKNKPAEAGTSQILAPVSGTVVLKEVYEGQYVAMGQRLYELSDFSTMWFQLDAYEQDIPWIKPGQTVNVTTPSMPGRVFTGKVTFIDPNFDPVTRSSKVRVELPNVMENGQHLLLHRLYADGEIKIDAPDILAVPRSAVIQTGPEAVVYVETGGGAYVRTVVKTGRKGDEMIEIISGLAAGDRVVTNGGLLIDGQAEMNRPFASPQPAPESSASLAEMSPDQKEATQRFVKTADAMAGALALDDLQKFNTASGPARDATAALRRALGAGGTLVPALQALTESAHFHEFKDLMEARTAFHKFTMAAIPVLEPLRTAKGAPDFKVWECYMVDRIIDGAPKTGRWVQVSGRAGQNPFFGSDMLDCVKEIKTGSEGR